MASHALVYYIPPNPKLGSPYRYDIPKGKSLDELVKEISKDHPRHHRIILRVYANPYEDWDMQGESLKWQTSWDCGCWVQAY